MDFELTDEQRAVQKTARDFAKNEVLPKAAEIDREHRHPEGAGRSAWPSSASSASRCPSSTAAPASTPSRYALAMEEISRACASTGVIMSVNNSLVCDPLIKFGTEEQKQEFLTPLASRQAARLLRAVASPRRARDAAAQKTIARAGRRRLGHQRHQELDHQRPGRRRLRPVHDERPGEGPQRHHRVHPADERRRACAPARPTRSSASAARSRARSSSTTCACPKTRSLGEVGGGFKVAMSHARRRAHRHRRAGARHRARGARGRARATRASARRSASRSRSTRRSSSCSPTWPPSSTRRACSRWRAAALKDTGRAPLDGVGDGQALRVRGRQPRGATRRCRSTAATATSRTSPSSATSATRKITEIYEGTSEIQRIVIAANLLKE